MVAREESRCEEIRKELSAYIDGFLSDEELAAVRKHLETCALCRQELDSLRETVALIQGLPELDVPEGFRSRVLERVAAEKAPVRTAAVGNGGRVGRLRSLFGKNPWLGAAVAAVLLLFVVFSIGQIDNLGGFFSVGSPQTKADRSGAVGVEPAPGPTEIGGAPGSGGKVAYSLGAAEEVAGEGSASDAAEPDTGIRTSELPSIMGGEKLVLPEDRKVIKEAQITLRVKDLPEASNQIIFLAESKGGYIQDSSYWRSGDQNLGSMTVRVPSTGFEKFLRELSDVGEIRSRRLSGRDVTREYVDVETRLANREAEARRIREILSRAERIQDVLMIERELARVEGEIESLKGQLRWLSSQISYSTLSIQLEEDPKPLMPTPGKDNFGKKFVEALLASIATFLRGIERIGVALAWALPYLVLVLILWQVYRRTRRPRQ